MNYKKPQVITYTANDILEQFGPCQNQYTTVTKNPDIDGYVVGDVAAVTNEDILAGDSEDNEGAHGFVSFNISDIQSTIVSARLMLYQWRVINFPYAPGALSENVIIAHVNFGASLEVGDFSPTTYTANVGTLSSGVDLEWKPDTTGLDVKSQVQADVDAGRARSQYMLYFTNTTDNNNTQDLAEFESSDNYGGTGNQPRLVITYY